MGRGRAKAKQTKVARELKYRAGSGTDLDALRAELVHTHVGDNDIAGTPVAEDDVDDDDDPYVDPYAADLDDDDESDETELARRWNVS